MPTTEDTKQIGLFTIGTLIIALVAIIGLVKDCQIQNETIRQCLARGFQPEACGKAVR